MNKKFIILSQLVVAKLGKVSKDTLGTLPGPRPEGQRPFKWISDN